MPRAAPLPLVAVPLTVSQLTRQIKAAVEEQPALHDVWVGGEISNCKLHTSGHLYFTLKDAESTLRCVMFRSRVQTLAFRPDHGLAVVLRGSIGVYERDGVYQCYVQEMQPAGLGALHQAYERLRTRLAQEGLFAEEAKRPLPLLPRAVALVTSPAAAALRDLVRVARRRCPGVPLILVPALVQGADAPASLVRAMRQAGALDVDVVILARGGGSLEELWAFNDEGLARAIRACPRPVVTGVGHETDFTIADFAADRRAPTPSAAAELVLPDREALRGELEGLAQAAAQAVRGRLRAQRQRLEALRRGPLSRPEAAFSAQRTRLDHGRVRLLSAGRGAVEQARSRWRTEAGRLEALSPLAVLGRGYAVCRRPDGPVVRRPDDAPLGSALQVLLQEGSLVAEVTGHGPGIGPVGVAVGGS